MFSRSIWVVVLLGPLDTEAAFELDGQESSLPFAARNGLYANPAELAAATCFSWSLGHHLPFGLRQLRRHSLGFTRSLRDWGGGAGLSSSGFRLHRELSAWLGAGRNLSRRFLAGVSLTLLHLHQHSARARLEVNIGLGLSLGLVRSLRLSAWWQNGSGTLAKPQLFVKVIHQQSGANPLYAHLRKRNRLPLRLDLAAEQRLHRRLLLLAGTRSSPRRFALGIEMEARRWWLRYAVVTHAQLGPSHTFTTGNTCRSP